MKGIRFIIVLAFLSTVVMGLPGSTLGQNLAEVFDVDDSYSKTLSTDEELTYVWLVYNRDVSDLVVTTSVEPTTGLGWEATVEPRYAVLGSGEGLNVNLLVSATEALEDGSVTFTLTIDLVLALEPTVSERETRTALTTLEAAPPVFPEENKILGIFDNPLPPPFNDRLVTFVTSIAIWAVFAALAILVVTPFFRRYARKTETQLDDVVLRILRGPLIVILIAYGTIQSLAILQLPAETMNLLFLIYTALLVLLLTWLAYRIFKGVVIEFGRRAAAKTETPLFDALWPVLSKVGALLILAIGASMVAGIFGLNLTAFIAGMGVLGIAIAFAAQESLSNFFSGIFLLMDRPFKEGDLIEINGDRCRIEKIGLRTTRLYHRPSHKMLVIPNNKMARDVIVNLVEPDETIRQKTTIGVAYGSDIERVKATIVAAAKENPLVIKDEPGREPYARLEEFGDYAMLFKLKFWVSSADKLNRVRGEVNETIVQRLDEAGIEIPVPIMTVKFENTEASHSRSNSDL
ncbi:MAG: mechanosensitive ion channel family protein [Thermoplasmata archaeon]